MTKITTNDNIAEMVKHVLDHGLLYSYLEEHAGMFGGLGFRNPEELFDIYLYDINFKEINVDLNKVDITFLDVLNAIPFCKRVEFMICRPAEGVIKTLIIE